MKNIQTFINKILIKKYRSQIVNPLVFQYMGAAILCLSYMLYPKAVQAQYIQRSFLNPSFEENLNPYSAKPTSPGFTTIPNSCYIQVHPNSIPGWETTHGLVKDGAGSCTGYVTPGNVPLIELWTTGFNSVSTATAAGRVLAELNAEQNSKLYQNLCIINNETITFSILHRGRSSDTTADVAAFTVNNQRFARFSTASDGNPRSTAISSPSPTNGASITLNTPSSPSNGWVRYGGSFQYTGTTGNLPIGFESISTAGGNATVGNFIDDAQFAGKPVIEVAASSGGAKESETTPISNPPQIRVVGLVPSGGITVPISINTGSSTAILGTDFTTPTGTANFTFTIPAGNYDGTATTGSIINIPFTVNQDNSIEGDETIIFSIGTSPDFLNFSTTSCGSSPIPNSSYTIFDDELDFGDAPDTYGTDKTANNSSNLTDPIGPSHIIKSNIYLGTTLPDKENDAATPLDGTGDDANNIDDEDGVTFNTLKEGDTSYSVTVKVTNNTGSNAFLVGWIDFNKNGTFEATEGVVASPNIATGTTGADVTLNWTGLSGITAGDTYARFRLSTDTLTTADFAGVKGVGEVEDYKLTIASISNPNVLLVKRITAINGTTDLRPNGQNMALYNQDDAYIYDDNVITNPSSNPAETTFWPNTTYTPPNTHTSTFLIGAIDGGEIKPTELVEYTIYFLSAGTADAKNTLLCDRLPSGTEFEYNTFETGKGIQLHYDLDNNGTLENTNLTNIGGDDQGRYFPPTIEPITVYPGINCGGPNTNGAVVVKLGVNDLDVDSPADPIDTILPQATSPGAPTTSYGYVRFRARFKN